MRSKLDSDDYFKEIMPTLFIELPEAQRVGQTGLQSKLDLYVRTKRGLEGAFVSARQTSQRHGDSQQSSHCVLKDANEISKIVRSAPMKRSNDPLMVNININYNIFFMDQVCAPSEDACFGRKTNTVFIEKKNGSLRPRRKSSICCANLLSSSTDTMQLRGQTLELERN